MSGFSIDDVRGTLAKDITMLLERIEASARDVVATSSASSLPKDRGWAPFKDVEGASHAIYGTSALVSATSLATSARLVEELAGEGARELARAVKHMERARKIADGVASGAAEMRAMLQLELEHRADDAQWHALTWEEQARAVLAAAEAVTVDDFDDAISTEPKSEAAFVIDEAFSVDPIQSELFEIFQGEVRESLQALSGHLEALTAHPESVADARAIERVFHTVKGAAATVGLLAVSEVAHSLQTKMEATIDLGAALSPELLGEVTQGVEELVRTVGVEPADGPNVEISSGEGTSGNGNVESISLDASVHPELWEVFTQECSELLTALDEGLLSLERTDDPRREIRGLRPTLHTLKGVVNTMGLAALGELLHRLEDFLEVLEQATTLPSMTAVVTCLLEVQAEVRRGVERSPGGEARLSLATLEARLVSVMEGPSAAVRRPASPKGPDLDAERLELASARNFTRVATERLDNLMNLAGELVVSRSRLLARVQTLRDVQADLGRGGRRLVERIDRFCEEYEFNRLDGRGAPLVHHRLVVGGEAWSSFSELELDRYEDIHVLSRNLAELTSDFGECSTLLANGLSSLMDDSDSLSSIINGIQSEVTRARMIPVDQLFARLRLPIRDAALREQKEVTVTTVGQDVHLDKTIADAVFQPMVHLVRNAVAHGIEHASVREASGKPREGVIELSARQELGQIIVEVRDDGAGLDLAKLKERGVAMGLVAGDVPLEDPRIRDLVFASGVSTEATAGAVAGRGLGCDVVRRALERMNGTVSVSSSAGGTSFVLTMPVTLTITKALLVRHGQHTFAIPLYFAERILDARDEAIFESAGARRVRIDDALVTLTELGMPFGTTSKDSVGGPLLVLRAGSERLALQVDAIVGEEEVVVKSLGAILAAHPLFAGVTIRGTGEMVLILDVPGLVRQRVSKVVRRRQVAAVSEDAMPGSEMPHTLASGASVPWIDVPRAEARPSVSRVLFVDDSLSVRKVAEKILNELGVEFVVAVDGVDALSKLRDASFDLVFTDLEMPRMHGFDLLREARFLPGCQDLPIIVVTSRSGKKHQEQARDLGASDYLTKPFTSHSLETAIARWSRARGRS